MLRFENRADGLYDVYCKDGRVERGVTLAKLTVGDVCNPVTSDDLGCSGDLLRSADVIGRFTAGATAAELGVYQLKGRSRICTAATGCSAWVSDSSAIPQGSSLGRTQINVVDAHGNVAVSFEQLPAAKTWLSGVALGGLLDGTAMGALLGGATGWTFKAGPIRKGCAAMKASKKEPVDALRTKEIEVTLRATHSLDRTVSPYFLSSRPVSLDCSIHRWDYRYTCSGFGESTSAGTGEGSIKVGAGGRDITYTGTSGWGKYTTEFDKTLTLDGNGVGSFTKPYDGTGYGIQAHVAGGAVLVNLNYTWTSSANWCGASTHVDFQCAGLVVAP